MQELVDSYQKSKTLHHAYFLVGKKEEIYPELSSFLEKKVGIKISGNPDFWTADFENLSIDEARNIADRSERKDFGGPSTSSGSPASPMRKIFIIKADFISTEAQNSLLKVFEEPTIGTYFFIISPQDILLPTLRSRMQVIKFGSDSEEKSKNILKKSLKERLLLVKEITEGISDEEKTKQDAISFLNEVEKELHDKGLEKSSALEVCSKTREYLFDRGAPIKIILENLMLSI